MRLINIEWLIWVVQGCPLYFAGISAAAAITAGVAAAGSVGGALISANASKKGAKTQAGAADEAAQQQLQSAREANNVATDYYGKGNEFLNNALAQARGDLGPYADSGSGALNQLGQMMRPEQSYIAPTLNAAQLAPLERDRTFFTNRQSETNAQLAPLMQQFDLSPEQTPTSTSPGQTKNPIWENVIGKFNNDHIAQFGKPFDRDWGSDADAQNQYNALAAEYQQGRQGLADQIKPLQASLADSGQEIGKYEGLISTGKGQEFRPAGRLTRDFSASDYTNDPVSGGRAPPDLARNFNVDNFLSQNTGSKINPADYQQGSESGRKITDAQIQSWFKSNPDATDYEIATAMQRFGVSAPQLAKATGTPLDKINSRLGALDVPGSKKTTADLMKNFDKAKFLGKGGKNVGDLTRDFNVDNFLGKGGKSKADLITNFDKAKFLAKGGNDVGDLTRNFNVDNFLGKGGKSKADLIADFDNSKFLAKGGKTRGDLFRDFTIDDFQADPGYQFRMDQGLRGVNNSAASRGNLLSGATLKAIQDYGQNLGSQEYGAAFNRFGQQQQTGLGALDQAQGQFNTNRSNLNDQTNNAYNRFTGNRRDLNSSLLQANNIFNANRSNLGDQTNNAYNRFSGNRRDLNASLLQANNTFNANRSNLSDQVGNAYNRFGSDRQNDSNVYQNSYERFNNNNDTRYNRLQGIIAPGQAAATNRAGYSQSTGANLANNATATANRIGTNLTGAAANAADYQTSGAAAQAAGYVGAGNAYNQGFSGVGNALNTGVQNYQQQQWLNNQNSNNQIQGGNYNGAYNSGFNNLNTPGFWSK